MALKNYVVMMLAPVNVRVRASSRQDAMDKATEIMSAKKSVSLEVENDDLEAWIDSSGWRCDVEDVTDGGIFISEVQGPGANIINPPKVRERRRCRGCFTQSCKVCRPAAV